MSEDASPAIPGTPGGDGPMDIGRFTFTAAEIVRFAQAFDPQPFHMDEAAARRSPYGTLIASGWQVVCVWMGFFVRAHPAARPLPGAAAASGPRVISPVGVGFSVEELKWLLPVRAGDTLTFATEVLEDRASGSRPGWRVYHRRASARREDGAEAMCFRLRHFAPVGL